MKTTLTITLLLIALNLFAQKNIPNFIVAYEQYSTSAFDGYLVSYDLELNILGRTDFAIQDRFYYYTSNHIFLYSKNTFGTNGFIYKYDKYFNLVKKIKLRKGNVSWVKFQEDYFLVKILVGLKISYVTYNHNLEIIGEIKLPMRFRYAGKNETAIIFTEAKSPGIVTKKIHLYDRTLQLINSTDRVQ